MENEYIVAPAIKKDNEIRISRFCHAEMISCDYFFKGAEQGFITNYDRFVDRKEALEIAKHNNSNLNKVCASDELYSEDLFRTESELVKENENLKQKNSECTSNTQMVKIPLDEYVRLQWEAGFSAGMLQILEQK